MTVRHSRRKEQQKRAIKQPFGKAAIRAVAPFQRSAGLVSEAAHGARPKNLPVFLSFVPESVRRSFDSVSLRSG